MENGMAWRVQKAGRWGNEWRLELLGADRDPLFSCVLPTLDSVADCIERTQGRTRLEVIHDY